MLPTDSIYRLTDTADESSSCHTHMRGCTKHYDEILNTAWALNQKISDSDTGLNDLEAILQTTGSEILERRLDKLKTYVSEQSPDMNAARLEMAFKTLAHENGKILSANEFKNKAKTQLAGIVITAHPTFSLSKDAWAFATEILTKKNKGAQGAKPEGLCLLPTASPSLEDELHYANAAIRNIRLSLRSVWRIFMKVTHELYPNEWQNITPSIATVASWVGFDLDGRTDIGWAQSLYFRYYTTLLGLEELQAFWASIDERLTTGSSKQTSDKINSAISTLNGCFADGLENLKKAESDNHYAAFNCKAVERRSNKDEARAQIQHCLNELIASDIDQSLALEIATFRAEWETIGLGLSHIHFRLNAAQLHNAIRPLINLQEAPDRSASRRHYLDAVANLLQNVNEETIHYGTLAEEQTTAKRVFMLAKQFRKHFDDNGSLRMLVAESDTPFTLLVALYYAKLFGVDDYVEISPLFETGIGLQRGDRVISELLDNPDFLSYIQKQGRFCVQLGFSDSGRYVGQVAASLAIERFKLRLIRLWKARGLSDIDLVFFDTHGESIGRGAHPRSMIDRFEYTHTPEVRRTLNAIQNTYKHEVSFQGGDGYLWFISEDVTLAVVTDLLTTRLKTPNAEPDLLYENSDWSLDFFLTLTETQEHLTEETGYLRLIDSIGQSMLYPTGSRAVKRQGRKGIGNRLESIGQIRAIPNNAVLQQLGYMANSITGVGAAANRNARRFSEIVQQSPRLRQIMRMSLEALKRSDVNILAAYLIGLSPAHWLDRCEAEAPSKKRSKMLRLSSLLEDIFAGSDMGLVLRDLRRDSLLLEDMLRSASNIDEATPQLNQTILALHTIRIALIYFIYMKAMEVPRFSSRQDISLHDLIDQILHLNIPDIVEELRKIFPAHIHNDDDAQYGEEASYDISKTGGYIKEHREIFDELEHAYELILKISSLLSSEIGAVG
ncbi:phosphoenolpyruvate carboxylase [Kordiimonas sp. SCSIO 12610]|uniref:phosphoenolpyruvate carboxylase n=1 Tax=Kordiimonas sp. SCSIO 12610 TaxID=2829597 RepID=UPI002108BD20|nr:phosphoenolpyruvate carboxylase [Kordiimonas sp. SCSIO 12610]UTW55847.1 phosphoenolpyruvate carboxylase [Kordiimonas sp. SCSIO 12610]